VESPQKRSKLRENVTFRWNFIFFARRSAMYNQLR